MPPVIHNKNSLQTNILLQEQNLLHCLFGINGAGILLRFKSSRSPNLLHVLAIEKEMASILSSSATHKAVVLHPDSPSIQVRAKSKRINFAPASIKNVSTCPNHPISISMTRELLQYHHSVNSQLPYH